MKCPYCAENIKEDASICKHCHSDLTTPHATSLFAAIEKEKEKEKKEKWLNSLSPTEKKAHFAEENRKNVVVPFCVLLLILTLPLAIASLATSNLVLLFVSATIALIVVWHCPAKGEQFFENRFTQWKKHGLRIAFSFLILLLPAIATIHSVNRYFENRAEVQEQEKIASAPQPEIEILSSTAHQGDSQEYLLEFKIKNAESGSVLSENGVNVVEEGDGKFSSKIWLARPSNTIKIIAKNEYKSAEKSLTITRNATATEKEEAKRQAQQQQEAQLAKEREKEAAAKAKEMEEQKKYTTEAHVCAQGKVKAMLTSPSTADFPWMDFSSVPLGNNSYLVTSYVDSENGFGATVRTHYTCEVLYLGDFDCVADCDFS